MEMWKHIKSKFDKLLIGGCLGMLFSIPATAFAQTNLVVNPDCDIYDTCPDNSFQITRALGWWSYDSLFGTPDYLNSCSGNSFAGIPSILGYQSPHSGEGYLHAVQVFSHKPKNFIYWNGPEYGNIQIREPIGGTLTRPLNPIPHKIEFYINFSSKGYDDGSGGGDGRIATNAFDFIALNSKDKALCPYNGIENIVNLNPLNVTYTDTLNWVKVSACFIPKGGESYFAIGVFRDTNDVQLEFSGATLSDNYIASYFFDSFRIYECDTCCLGEFSYPDHTTVSNNPGGGGTPTTFTTILNGNTTATLSIYDSAGRLVARNEFSDMYSQYVLEDRFAVGVYHYRFESSNGIKDYGKILITK